MSSKNKRIAIVLFNLGGPSSLAEVPKFLFSLFSDPNIIRLPYLLRICLAKLIAITRSNKAKKIYAQIGGKSPILEETEKQKQALGIALKLKEEFKVFICMRHAAPTAQEVVQQINSYNPNQIILLPLYPHFSTTTSGSSIADFIKTYKKFTPNNQTIIKSICCYPTNAGFIESHLDLIKEGIAQLKDKDNFRILFSAHSLPEKIINAGDPYQWQTELSISNIINRLENQNLDYRICYQSKVGPVKWLSPSTEEEIINAGKEQKSILIVPISFVSEHSETLVELDIDYRHLAKKYHIEYIRIPALSINKLFIQGLSQMVSDALATEKPIICPTTSGRLCPRIFHFCPYTQ